MITSDDPTRSPEFHSLQRRLAQWRARRPCRSGAPRGISLSHSLFVRHWCAVWAVFAATDGCDVFGLDPVTGSGGFRPETPTLAATAESPRKCSLSLRLRLGGVKRADEPVADFVPHEVPREGRPFSGLCRSASIRSRPGSPTALPAPPYSSKKRPRASKRRPEVRKDVENTTMPSTSWARTASSVFRNRSGG
jgi:hypothetical protein